ncbi:hypothetical protein CVT26_000673 [Gymnopilus dilepis]|uniref:Uncharacterized protein n=1 Tax=Gymnopilus dilepis TaxID=231916 RepID=A0A409WYP0_9AGAR|nr:hypothetical protein CVT26_000673 [Gymnopilus dilepis]
MRDQHRAIERRTQADDCENVARPFNSTTLSLATSLVDDDEESHLLTDHTKDGGKKVAFCLAREGVGHGLSKAVATRSAADLSFAKKFRRNDVLFKYFDTRDLTGGATGFCHKSLSPPALAGFAEEHFSRGDVEGIPDLPRHHLMLPL